jgi:hypothetical protein
MSGKRDKLVKLLTISYEEQKKYLGTTTDSERAAAGKIDDWSPKDTMALFE